MGVERVRVNVWQIAAIAFAASLLVLVNASAIDGGDALDVPQSTEESVTTAKTLSGDSNITIDFASQTLFDLTPPETPDVSSPGFAPSGPVDVSFSSAADAGGSGLAKALLWKKVGSGGTWTNTGLIYEFQGEETSGTITLESIGQGDHYFWVRLEDAAGNLSAAPTGDSTAHTVLDDSKPVLSLIGNAILVAEVGGAFNDPGATASDPQEGDLTSKVQAEGNVNTASLGTYTIAYTVSDTAGNEADPIQRTVSVIEPSSAYALDIVQPSVGGIVANPAPNAANNNYVGGTIVSLLYAAAEDQQVTEWIGAIPDGVNANRAKVVMDSNKQVSVKLGQATGTVRVDVTPNQAGWTVTDASGGTHNGTGDSTVDVPSGDVTVSFNDLDGYTKPGDQSDTVGPGGTVDFAGLYLEGNRINFTAPRNLTGQPGQTVACPISIDKGEGLTAYSFSLQFDGNLVEVQSVEAGAATTSWGAPNSSPSSGGVSVSGNGSAVSGGGVIARIIFLVKDTVTESSSTELTFANTSVTTSGGEEGVSSAAGKLSVELGEFLWGDANSDGNVDASDANALLGFAVGSSVDLPSFDKQAPEEGGGGANVSTENPPVIGAFDAALVLQYATGDLSSFPTDRNGDGQGPDLTEDKSADSGGSLLEQLDKAVTRTVRVNGALAVDPNTTINVPIRLDIGDRVMAYKVVLTYDPEVLQFNNVSKSELTNSWLAPVISDQPGELTIAAAGPDELTEGGAIATVSFVVRSNVAPGMATDLGLPEAVLNDGQLTVQTQDDAYQPDLTLITPGRGAEFGGTVVALQGLNLGDIDTVYFGSQVSPHVKFLPEANILTAIAPAGAGTVDVTAQGLGQSSMLTAAYTYFAPDISVYPDPEDVAKEGDFFDVPIVLGGLHANLLQSVEFTLNYDPRSFTIRKNTPLNEYVFLGPAAAGATVSEPVQLNRDQWRFTLTGALSEGHICTIQLLTFGHGNSGDSVIYITDVAGGGAEFDKMFPSD